MKTKFSVLFLVIFLIIQSTDLFAAAKIGSSFTKQKQRLGLDQKAESIELRADYPNRPYEHIDIIYEYGMIEKDKDYARLALKRRAYKLKGDAVLGVICKKSKFGERCSGTVVRWTD